MPGILMYVMRSAIVVFAYGFYGRVDFEAPDKVSVDLSLFGRRMSRCGAEYSREVKPGTTSKLVGGDPKSGGASARSGSVLCIS
jgi:hypothetical protein